jgi:hypothetical protein
MWVMCVIEKKKKERWMKKQLHRIAETECGVKGRWKGWTFLSLISQIWFHCLLNYRFPYYPSEPPTSISSPSGASKARRRRRSKRTRRSGRGRNQEGCGLVQVTREKVDGACSMGLYRQHDRPCRLPSSRSCRAGHTKAMGENRQSTRHSDFRVGLDGKPDGGGRREKRRKGGKMVN